MIFSKNMKKNSKTKAMVEDIIKNIRDRWFYTSRWRSFPHSTKSVENQNVRPLLFSTFFPHSTAGFPRGCVKLQGAAFLSTRPPHPFHRGFSRFLPGFPKKKRLFHIFTAPTTIAINNYYSVLSQREIFLCQPDSGQTEGRPLPGAFPLWKILSFRTGLKKSPAKYKRQAKPDRWNPPGPELDLTNKKQLILKRAFLIFCFREKR